MSSTSPSRAPDKNEGVHQANASDPTSIGSAPPAVAPTGSSAHTDGRRPEITRCSNSAKHPRWKCNVCNYHFNPNQQEAHLASNAHLSRVAENDRRIEATQRRLEEARKRQQQGREDAQVAAPSTGRRRNDKGKRFKLSGANTMHAQEDKTGTTTDLTMPGELQAERERSGSSNWLSQPLRSNESPSEYEPSGRHRRKRPSKRKQKVSSQPQQPPTVPGQSTNIGELSIAEEPQPATEQPPNAVPLVSTRPVFSEKQPPREAKPKNFESPHNRPAMEKVSEDLQKTENGIPDDQKVKKESESEIERKPAPSQSECQPPAFEEPSGVATLSQNIQPQELSLVLEKYDKSKKIKKTFEKLLDSADPNLDLPPAAQHSAKIEDPTKNVIEKIQKLLEARESKEISEKIPEISSHKDLLPELKKTDELSGIDKPQQEGSIPSVEKDTKGQNRVSVEMSPKATQSMDVRQPFNQMTSTMRTDQRRPQQEQLTSARRRFVEKRDQSQGSRGGSQGSRGGSQGSRGGSQGSRGGSQGSKGQPRGKRGRHQQTRDQPRGPTGRPHESREGQPLSERLHDTKNTKKKDEQPSSGKSTEPEHWWCEPCNRTMFLRGKVPHENGAQHFKAVRRQIQLQLSLGLLPKQPPPPRSDPGRLSKFPRETLTSRDPFGPAHSVCQRGNPDTLPQGTSMSTLSTNIEVPPPLNSGHVNKPSREGFYCDVCKYIFDHKDIHLASIMHTQKVARQNSDTNGGQNDLKSTNRSHGHTRSQTHTYGGYYSQQPSVHEYHGFPSLPPTPTLLRREVPLRQQEDQYRTENYPIGLHYGQQAPPAGPCPQPSFLFHHARISPQQLEFPNQQMNYYQQQTYPLLQQPWSPKPAQFSPSGGPAPTPGTRAEHLKTTPSPTEYHPHGSPKLWSPAKQEWMKPMQQKSCFQRQWYPSTEQWQSQFIQPRSYTANLPYPASNYTPAMPQRWSCDICQVSVDAQNREAHLGSGFHRSRAAHRNKVIEVMQRPKPIQKLWTCKICKAVVAETEMANHLLGEQHSKVIIANLEAARSWKVPGAVLEPTQIVAPTPEPVPAAKEYVALEIKNGDGKEAGGGEKSAYGSEDDEFYGLVP